jgi:energy-coupling factor transport system ATP-binding protein
MSIPVALEGVSFQYPDGTQALRGVDLLIHPGERLALVGQNGSGKSTLVRHLNGLLRPTSGRVLIDGQDALERRVAALSAVVGLAFQNPDRQIFASNVKAEVEFGPRILGRRGQDLETAVRQSLNAVGMDGLEGAHPYDLGYSRRKLLAIASVLAMETPVIVLDEPTTGQDARGVAQIERLVTELAGGGRTVLAISHDMRFVAEAFERVVVMREGSFVLDGPPDVVFSEANWKILGSTFLEPPYAATVGARLGLGSTPTEEALIAALAARGADGSAGGAAGHR